MEWLNGLRGRVVAIDTAPFIYFIERHPRYLPAVQPLFHSLDQGEFVAVTSSLTLLEVLVLPIRNRNADLAVRYREIIARARNLSVLPVNTVVAESAAGLRHPRVKDSRCHSVRYRWSQWRRRADYK